MKKLEARQEEMKRRMLIEKEKLIRHQLPLPPEKARRMGMNLDYDEQLKRRIQNFEKEEARKYAEWKKRRLPGPITAS